MVGTISTDDVHDALMTPRRRRVLRHLAGAGEGEWITADELARALVGTTAGAGTDDTLATASQNLRRCTLPILAGHDVVEYDPDCHRVQRGENFNSVYVVHRTTRLIIEDEDAWEDIALAVDPAGNVTRGDDDGR